MAIKLATISDYLSRASGLLPIGADFTVMFWTLNDTPIVTTPTTGWAEIDAYPLSTDGVQLSTGTHPGSFYRAEKSGGFFAEVEDWTTYFGNGIWNHHAIAYDNGTGFATMYVNGSAVSSTSLSGGLGALSVALEVLGNNGNSTIANHYFIYYRSWDTKLTAPEIDAERLSATVVKTANLWMDTPLLTNANDISGNGRNWTVNGSATYSAITPINPPPDSTVLIITTPYSRICTAAEFNAGTFGGNANEIWFKYVSDDDQILGFSTTDPFSVGIQVPKISIYGPGASPLLESWTGTKGGGYRVLNGETYFIKIERNGSAGAADQNFTVTSTVLGYLTSVPDGTVIINDDADGFPALAFAIDGTFLGYITNIPAGEMGDSLPNGISIWHDRFAASNKIKLIARDLTTIAQFDITGLGSLFPRFGHSDTDFYASDAGSPAKIYKITTAGVVSLQATLSGVYDNAYVIAINSAGTIAYYIDSDTDNIIHRWDLVNDIALTDLYTITGASGSYRIAKTPNGHPGDILRLSDGSLVTWYRNFAGSGQDTLIQVSSTGTLLNSFNMSSPNYEIDHLAYSSSNPNSVRIWLHIGPNYSTGIVGDYDLTTGSFTTSFTTDLYSELISTNGTQLFGPSNSCTMVSILDAAPSGTATLIITKETVPTPDETDTTFLFTTTGGLSPSTFDLKDGETQTYTGLSAGTYGISETVPAGWSVGYNVDNGDPHTAIILEEGDTVTITVTNTSTGPGPVFPGNPNSGIYKIVPDKRDDTLWESFSPKRVKLTRIP